jgi:uncharacterized protein
MKMKLFLLFLAIFSLSVPLFGVNRVLDGAALLSEDGIARLNELVDKISLAYDFDLVIVSLTGTGGVEPMDWAAEFFDKNGYGLGKNRDGCLFLAVTDSQVFWFSTSGRGIKILNPTATKKMENEVNNFLGRRDFYNAFVAFAENWEKFLVLDAKGRSYNFFSRNNAVLVVLAWLVPLGAGFLIVEIWKKGMNTAIPKKQDAACITPGSLSFAVQKDQFLYSTVTKIDRESESDFDSDTDTSSSEKTNDGSDENFKQSERRPE